MSTETNKNNIRRIFEEGINQNKTGVLDELIAASYVNHDFPTPAAGSQGFKMVIAMFRGGFPDLRVIVEQTLGEGDRVSTRGYFTGTHKGEFNGIPATGKTIKVAYIDIWRLENGKAVENWVLMDMIAMMQQLGVMPSPTQA
jgi:steroid delta-isomerase-like uncharacterized protein